MMIVEHEVRRAELTWFGVLSCRRCSTAFCIFDIRLPGRTVAVRMGFIVPSKARLHFGQATALSVTS